MALEVLSTKYAWRIGEEAPQLSAQGETGTVNWATTRGTLSNEGVGPDVSLSMPNQSWYGTPSLINGNEAVKITASDDENVVIIYIDVYANFPFQADWSFQSPIDEDTEISRAEDNNEIFRILSGLSGSWQMTFKDREHTEYLEALQFRAFHGKTRRFYIQELGLEEIQLVRFDSAFNRSPVWADGRDYGFTIYCNDWKISNTNILGDGGGSLFGDVLPGSDLFGG